jgi:hypothetical protein
MGGRRYADEGGIEGRNVVPERRHARLVNRDHERVKIASVKIAAVTLGPARSGSTRRMG